MVESNYPTNTYIVIKLILDLLQFLKYGKYKIFSSTSFLNISSSETMYRFFYEIW